jgi:carboxyl-terminal processing protease
MADAENKIAVIRLEEFNETSGKEVEAAVKEVVAAGAKGLVLDMRNNPGGLLRVAEQISDLFLADGKIVLTRDRHDHGRDVKAKNDGAAWEDATKLPMAVLINGNSASAAEIVAAALQDNGRAVVVGERSYGKGSVQRSIESPDGKTALKLTTEIWLTPNGKHIHRRPGAKPEDEWGVKPDGGFEVPMSEEQVIQYLLHLREADMGRKVPADPPKEPEPKPDPGKPKRFELPKIDPKFKDPVLEKAMEHLRAKAKTAGARRALGGPA